MSTGRCWVVHFSRPTATWKTSHVPDSHAQLTHYKMMSSSISSSMQLTDYDQGTGYEAGYWLQLVGNNGGNAGIPQSLHHVDAKNAHTRTEGTTRLSLSGCVEETWNWRCQFPGMHHYWRQNVVSSLRARVKTTVQGLLATWTHVATYEFPRKHEVQDAAFSSWCALSSGIGKGEIQKDFLELGQAITYDCYIATLSWRLKLPVRPEKTTTFL